VTEVSFDPERGVVMYRTIYNSVQIQPGAPCTAVAMAEHVTAARRFPAPWKAEKMPGGYVVRDANGQALAHVYSRATMAEAKATV
jgi:hypothetical protein